MGGHNSSGTSTKSKRGETKGRPGIGTSRMGLSQGEIPMGSAAAEENEPGESSDTKYADAVKRGDVKTAQKMVGDAAKAAGFGMGKDKSVVMHHGTSTPEGEKEFTTFDDKKIGSSSGNFGWFGKGFYFTENPEYAKEYKGKGGGKPRVISAYLSVKNPFVLSVSESYDPNGDLVKHYSDDTVEALKNLPGLTKEEIDEIEDATPEYSDSGHDFVTEGDHPILSPDRFRELVMAAGHDGVVVGRTVDTVEEVEDDDGQLDYEESSEREPFFEVAVFEPSQIKSAKPIEYGDDGEPIPLSKRFDSGKDMRGDVMGLKNDQPEAKQSDPLDTFYAQHKIDPDNLSYLGKGDFGEAYSIGDGRVLKNTSSKSEFEIAKELIGKKFEHIAKVYAAEKVGGYHRIVLEEVDEDSDIENKMGEVESMLSEQGLPIQYIDNFDEDEYTAAGGEISDDTRKFMEELHGVVSDYRRLGIEASDIKADNLGRDKETGVLKAFDIEDRAQTRR